MLGGIRHGGTSVMRNTSYVRAYAKPHTQCLKVMLRINYHSIFIPAASNCVQL